MALIFMDGFDYFDRTQITRKWTAMSDSTQVAISSDTRTGVGQSLRLDSFSATRFINKVLDTGISEAFVQFALKVASGSAAEFLLLHSGGTAQLRVRFASTGTITILRNTTTLATYMGGVLTGWNYFELKLKISNSITAGDVLVKMNSVEVLSLAGGTDTQNDSSSNLATIIQIQDSGTDSYWDDFIFMDNVDDGTGLNTLIGDHKIQTLYPNANGDENDFTATGDSENWQCADDPTVQDDDSTYTSSGTVGDKQLFGFNNLTGSIASIAAIAINTTARKDDAGARGVRPLLKTNSTEEEGNDIALGDSYSSQQQLYGENPITAAAWTATEINAIQAGLKIQS